jgi:hypothetical protein
MSRRAESRDKTESGLPVSRLKHCFTLSGLLLALLALAGCEPKRIPPPADTIPKYPPMSEKLDVDLLFDVTLSMQGFTRTHDSSYYQQVIPLLEQAVITGTRGKASYMRFGDEITPLQGRDVLLARTPEFYEDPKDNRRTLIEHAIERANPDHLTILITDLFQNNADVNQLSEQLKEKYLAKGLAVGVMGIRSQYDGTVYDVGQENLAFPYKSAVEPQTGRPFYLLALGSYANIAHYFSTLMERGVSAFPEKHALILSRFITDQPALFRSAPLESAERISETGVDNLLTQSYQGEQIKAFRVNGGKADVRFGTSWVFRPLPFGQSYATELAPEIAAWKGEEAAGAQLTLVENAQAVRALRLKASLLPERGNPNIVRFVADLNIRALPGAGIYRYRVVLRPVRYSLPEWVGRWNMPAGKLASWREMPKAFDGATTFNLEHFLSTLQGAALRVASPEAAQIYFDIRVDP